MRSVLFTVALLSIVGCKHRPTAAEREAAREREQQAKEQKQKDALASLAQLRARVGRAFASLPPVEKLKGEQRCPDAELAARRGAGAPLHPLAVSYDYLRFLATDEPKVKLDRRGAPDPDGVDGDNVTTASLSAVRSIQRYDAAPEWPEHYYAESHREELIDKVAATVADDLKNPYVVVTYWTAGRSSTMTGVADSQRESLRRQHFSRPPSARLRVANGPRRFVVSRVGRAGLLRPKGAGSMKRLLACVGLLLMVGSCGGDSTGDMSPDLGSTDLIDALDLFGDTGCKGLIACSNACPPLNGNCASKCFQSATPSGMSRYAGAINCVQTYCVNVNHCAWANAAMTMVKSVPGDVPAICDDCLNDSASTLFGNACRHSGSADCTQMQCNQVFAACLNDLP